VRLFYAPFKVDEAQDAYLAVRCMPSVIGKFKAQMEVQHAQSTKAEGANPNEASLRLWCSHHPFTVVASVLVPCLHL
jgi:hypothetical protein